MLGTHDLPLFIVSGLLLNLTPGADSLYVVTRSIAQGARAGVVAALGIAAGCCVHVLAAALGLSAILAASATAFTVVKLLGATYLVYLGVSLLRRRPSPTQSPGAVTAAPGRTIFAQGFLTNLLNPKVALFFLAFVPQFIDQGAANTALSFVLLGVIFNFGATLWCFFLAWSAARLGAFGAGRRVSSWLSRGVGALFVVLGVRLALSK